MKQLRRTVAPETQKLFPSIDLVKIFAILGSIFTAMNFVGVKTFGFMADDRKLVDKPYVDERFNASKLYTDEKSAYAIKESLEQSNRNRQDTQLKMEQMNSETRLNHSVVQTKLDFMLNSLEQLSRPMSQTTLSQVNESKRIRGPQ